MDETPGTGRFTAPNDRELVVFLLGARINKLTAVRSWAPVIIGFRRMLAELRADPDSGLLGFRILPRPPRLLTSVQYWESAEKLYSYASDPARRHRPAWTDFYRRRGEAGEHVGIWHETYLVPARSYESIYVAMPESGLARAFGSAPVGRGTDRAADRLRGVRRSGCG
ncbi:protein of unknown function [Saccharopolyspora kobensis]|uniref:DUF4188 domain-containing protein n=1 Tax=Saccharopolyspora kobensis TaxID=146035 RepID=A0A1H5ZRB1_9PSEU|nr:DUF4188 domain-containing protein [Saccharopolyspora kobensis]SEG38710.1 protein of unknown function [Saccharopolyspora kobensis]SFE12372.1 protein of unknown function [Saccharopolyspora kobensis]